MCTLIGTWVGARLIFGTLYLRFQSDGTWQASFSPGGFASPVSGGTWTVVSGVLSIVEDLVASPPDRCTADQTGHYGVAFSPGCYQVTLTSEGDPCDFRGSILGGSTFTAD